MFLSPPLQPLWPHLAEMQYRESPRHSGLLNQAPSLSRHTHLFLQLEPLFPWHPPQAFSPARTLRLSPFKYHEQRHAPVGLAAFPLPSPISLTTQVFSSQVSSDYQGIQTCKLKSLHFLKTSVLLNWFGVKGSPYFQIKQLHHEIECSYTKLRENGTLHREFVFTGGCMFPLVCLQWCFGVHF